MPLFAAVVGCNVVEGFDHAGDALFPPAETYLDVPGYRMTAGHFRYLDTLTSSEPFILARSATDGDDTLFAMHYHSPTPCAIPDVGAYWTDAGPQASRTYLAYFDASGTSTLRFSDLDCTPIPFTLENAALPVGFTATGLAIPIGADLFDVDPGAETTKLLASAVESIDVQRHIVRAQGQLGVFDAGWGLVQWVGEGVVTSLNAFGATYFEDAAGIERLTINDNGDTRVVATTTVASEACAPTALPEIAHLQLLAYYAPCASKQLFVWDAKTHTKTRLDLDAEPAFLKIQALPASGHPDLAEDPYLALYLSDVDENASTGSLRLRLTDGSVLPLGEGAALDRSDFVASTAGGSIDGGFALLDVDGETGRFVRFDLAGNVSDVASGVIRRPAEPSWTRLVLDADGEVNDLAEIVDGQAVTVATHVPPFRYAYVNRQPHAPLANRMAWFHDLDGDTGTLSLAGPNPKSGSIDDQGHEPLYTSTAVAHDVFWQGHAFMGDLPGFVYYTHWQAATRTGRLEYSNVELGFSAIVSEGVGDYVQPGEGLLYSVPFGEGAGIWLARGK